MSEESSHPAPQAETPEKAPRKKAATPSPVKSDQPAKSAKPKEPHSKDTGSDAAETATRPIKRVVRVVKKSATKKSASKRVAKNKQAVDAETEGGQPQKKTEKAAAEQKKSKPTSKETQEPAPNEDSAKQSQQPKQGRQPQPPRGRGGRNRGRQPGQQDQREEPKVKVDAQKVAKRAWKIFVGEVNEEGLALIADKDARELARRSLRVAEIYSREEAIQLQNGKKAKKKVKKEDQKA